MKKDQVFIGRTYLAKVSGQLAQVRIDRENPHGGWDATNLATRRKVRIKCAQRLRRAVAAKSNAAAVPRMPVATNDAPPRNVDERLAAAPPSIVPYEVRRARAEAAQPPAEADPPADPSRCATQRCKATPVMTYLGRPLCSACWARQCAEDEQSSASKTTGEASRPDEDQEPIQEENEMSKKKSTKKQSTKKQTKAQPVAAKANGAKKAGKPKATAKARATTDKKPKRVSALDAAAQVLVKAGKPMRAQELIAAMAEAGLWTSPGGKTPHATLYAAMMREARDKGRDSRFKKVDRGMFASSKEGK